MEKFKEEKKDVLSKDTSLKHELALEREKMIEEMEKGVSKALDETWGEVKPEFIDKFLEKLRGLREINPIE